MSQHREICDLDGSKCSKSWSRYNVHTAGTEKVEMHIEILLENVLKNSQLEG
jgi:hypothetical protein